MSPGTQEVLERLRQSDWFGNIGRQDLDEAGFVDSWASAVASCSSAEWEAVRLEAANQLREAIFDISPERFGRWNDVAAEARATVRHLVEDKTQDAINVNHLPSEFFKSVYWDIVHLYIETEYADVFPPLFYASQAYWYLNGHFPCGWNGAFPDGEVVVY